MNRLADKIAVITGGTSGIGLATARVFKENGARVITNARNEQRKAETLDAYGDLFDAVHVADVTSVAELDDFFAKVGAAYGRVDVLFLNAGAGKPAPIEVVTEASFDQEMAVNLKGVYFGIQKALPYLQEGASIVLNTSIVNQKGMAGFSVYSAAKAAVASLIRSLSAEFVDRGIRVNAVSPGPIETPFFSKTGMNEEQINQAAQQIISQVPIKRFGKPEEVAKFVLFLASDESSFMLGTETEVDGGMATL